MNKLLATIKKDVLILLRDKIGLSFMFMLPILLAVLLTSIQNSTFKLVNENKIELILCNKDSGTIGRSLEEALERTGMFDIKHVGRELDEPTIRGQMLEKNALAAIVIPDEFSLQIENKSSVLSHKILAGLGMKSDTVRGPRVTKPILIYYHPVLQESFRQSVTGALQTAIQMVESKQLLNGLYYSLNQKKFPEELEGSMLKYHAPVSEITVFRDGGMNIPNATQHNIPAWTVFAMFFVVISLGSSVVKEKTNGSFLRLKTMPSGYLLSIISKQITYILVTVLQAIIIFAIGAFAFPFIGLPALNYPSNGLALLLVIFVCGWCAVSYAICIGTFAKTRDQANGFGAATIIILAAIGGIMVPSFAMPAALQQIMKISPLHWCLESFYGLFLEGGKLKDIMVNILPLFAITLVLQFISFRGLKSKNLI